MKSMQVMSFDKLKPPDVFADLKSELTAGSFAPVKEHVNLIFRRKISVILSKKHAKF